MRSALAAGLLAAQLLGQGDGHGLMLTPTARGARGGLLSRGGSMWYTQSTTIGCSVPNVTADVHASMLGGDLCPEDRSGSKVPTINDPELRTWMAQGCLEPGTTIPAPPRAKVAPCTETNANTDWTKFHPWRAPGSAPTYDACGVAGASPSNDSNAAGGWGFPTGHAQGFPGSQLPPVAKEERDVWSIRAGTAEVAWTSVANHGGGYQYSLCPVGSQLTEACFHKLPLQFASDKQVLRYMYTNQTDNKTEVEITATRVSQGTIPAGSTWTRNPV